MMMRRERRRPSACGAGLELSGVRADAQTYYSSHGWRLEDIISDYGINCCALKFIGRSDTFYP
jgi:hypothetical protein